MKNIPIQNATHSKTFWNISPQCPIRGWYFLFLKEQTHPAPGPGLCCALPWIRDEEVPGSERCAGSHAVPSVPSEPPCLSDSPSAASQGARKQTPSAGSASISLAHAPAPFGKEWSGFLMPSSSQWLWGRVYSPEEEFSISSSCANLF